MATDFIILVFALSLFLYAFLAGADFGAGILEILPIGIPRKERAEIIGNAIGPVWEANHIWLILALVIAFNGFPNLFWFVSEFFHFPLGTLVMGIIFRGASFTFMHYDPLPGPKVQKVYHWIFGLSSLWCTLWLGVIVGSVMLGNFTPDEQEVYGRYFAHWLNPFPFAMGVFITTLVVFNASLFLYVESTANRKQWRRVTLTVFGILVLTGLMVHLVLFWQSADRWELFFLNPLSVILILSSGFLLVPQYVLIKKQKRNLSRIIAGVQLMAIMGAGFAPLFPAVILFKDGSRIDFYQSAAEPDVMKALAWALLFGCIFILPSYVYLMRIFKSRGRKTTNEVV